MFSQGGELLSIERLKEIQEDGFLKHGESKLLAVNLLAYREAQGKPAVCEYGESNGDGSYSVVYGRYPIPSYIKVSTDWPIKLFCAAPQLPVVIGWINEDELPENYPYDQMFPFSKVDVVRMFPVYAPMQDVAPPELTVWYGEMPETNGKSNWTAILHRKGECLSTGMTIERSEYPDRVRYEADRMRHLIGELDKAPDILDYDAGKHSGYAKEIVTPVSCEWAWDENDYYWLASCGHTWTFTEGDPKENGVNFCHCCGKPVIHIGVE